MNPLPQLIIYFVFPVDKVESGTKQSTNLIRI